MPTIVMADNQPTHLEMMKVLLEYGGQFRVVSTCTNGLTALAHVYARSPELLVADIGMPGMDGIALIRRLRDEGFDLPILAVSPAGMPRAAQRARDAGASGIVNKVALLGELTVAARVVLNGGLYFPADVQYGGYPWDDGTRWLAEAGTVF